MLQRRRHGVPLATARVWPTGAPHRAHADAARSLRLPRGHGAGGIVALGHVHGLIHRLPGQPGVLRALPAEARQGLARGLRGLLARRGRRLELRRELRGAAPGVRGLLPRRDLLRLHEPAPAQGRPRRLRRGGVPAPEHALAAAPRRRREAWVHGAGVAPRGAQRGGGAGGGGVEGHVEKRAVWGVDGRLGGKQAERQSIGG